MEAHWQRVIDEKRDLDEKIAKLRVFLEDPLPSVDRQELQRLEEQLAIMIAYTSILAERLFAAGHET